MPVSDNGMSQEPTSKPKQDALRRALLEKKLRSLSLVRAQPRTEQPPGASGEFLQEQRRKEQPPGPAGELSHAQRRIWFLSEMGRRSGWYNIPGPIWIDGPLSTIALCASVAEVARRHQSLRTVFPPGPEGPRQTLLDEAPVIRIVDLQEYESIAADDIARGLMEADALYPFDLARGPLIRATLVRVAPSRSLLLLTLHHIASDAWSQGILMKELGELYQRFANGNPSDLPEPKFQYSDYVALQRAWLASPAAAQQSSYWRRQLKGVESLRLPTDYPRPEMFNLAGAVCEIEIDSTLAVSLRHLARNEDVTLFMLMLAVFAILLRRHTGQRDFAIGTPVTNRNRPETQQSIGLFLNTLALRLQISEEMTFREALRQTRDVCLEAYNHLEFPFDLIVEELRPARDLGATPLFQVGFTFQHMDPVPVLLGGIALRPAQMGVKISKYDWMMDVLETGRALRIRLEYRTDLFAEVSIRRALHHYEALLAAAVASPEARVGLMEMLSPTERWDLAGKWNETDRPGHADRCIHDLINEVARSRPDAVAVADDNWCLTYGELVRRANRVARMLRRRGAREEAFVGIWAMRVPETIVCLLAVLKAGAAYVPLDPDHPYERHLAIAAETRLKILIVPGGTVSDPHLPGCDVVRLDWLWDESLAEDAVWVPAQITPYNLAYVIYTSGSTGTPKGVLLQHGGPANYVASQVAELAVGEDSRMLSFASAAVDASIAEVFTALVGGACVCIARKEQLLGGKEMVGLLSERQITHMFIPPSLLALLAPEEQGTLNTVVSAGEACPVEIAAAWSVRVRLFNGYGPTETSVGPLLFPVPAEALGWRGVPIGKPVWNTRAYVLTGCYELAPFNVAGEIVIAGCGLARGYFNRPDLTAERFVPNPFSAAPGARMYRTGDLGRRLSDGNIGYVGRADFQVKIRGNRVELGEIESILRRHPGVQDACVVASGELAAMRLGAFVTSSEPTSEDLIEAGVTVQRSTDLVAELQQLLREQVPEYMRPSRIAILPTLPRLTSGKVDRSRLASMVDISDAPPKAVALPRTEDEKRVAKVWQNVLKREEVGVDENFFEAGGHSLSLTLLSKQLSEVLGREVTIFELYRFPTISSFVRHAFTDSRSGDPAPVSGSRARMRQVAALIAQTRRSGRLVSGTPSSPEK